MHALWDLGPTPYAHRRAEDLAAVALLGARGLHGQQLDALYRADTAGHALYPTRQSIFSAPPAEDRIGDTLFDLFGRWINEISPDLVLAPLGVGRHADHIQTTNALRRLASTRPINVALYEDMPYATGLFPVAAPDNVAAARERSPWRLAGSHIVGVDIAGKLAAIAAYASQLADIFPNGLEFDSVIGAYMRQPDGTCGERIWEALA